MPRVYVFPSPEIPSVQIAGTAKRFAVRRIFCVGRNYGQHVREMGGDPKSDPPIFFTKPADALVATGETIPFPIGTSNLHHEIELVVALGKPLCQADLMQASKAVFGLAAGIDLTRRDLQHAAKSNGLPWDSAKAFDQSAPIGAIQPISELPDPLSGQISLTVNGESRQNGDLSQMIWSIPQLLSQLSQLFKLEPGDLVFTGTPDGVGPLHAGDHVVGQIEGVGEVNFRLN
ncbi:MAG: fumarylacetoacetate hydrolase [Robiginitomaculum sp.]|nr:MAG: fumarylacetoacetate hydrolase [Robiginitomaculum sp.]